MTGATGPRPRPRLGLAFRCCRLVQHSPAPIPYHGYVRFGRAFQRRYDFLYYNVLHGSWYSLPSVTKCLLFQITGVREHDYLHSSTHYTCANRRLFSHLPSLCSAVVPPSTQCRRPPDTTHSECAVTSPPSRLHSQHRPPVHRVSAPTDAAALCRTVTARSGSTRHRADSVTRGRGRKGVAGPATISAPPVPIGARRGGGELQKLEADETNVVLLSWTLRAYRGKNRDLLF